MTPAPRLFGPRVALVPAPRDVAVAAVEGPGAAVDGALAPLALRAGTGWPHADSADGLRAAADADPTEAFTWLVVVDRSVLGECGWTSRPDRDGSVDIGYGLAAPSRGCGLGTEAVATLVAWTLSRPAVERVAADVLRANEASRRLLRRLGFVEHPHDARWVRAVFDATGPLRGRHVC